MVVIKMLAEGRMILRAITIVKRIILTPLIHSRRNQYPQSLSRSIASSGWYFVVSFIDLLVQHSCFLVGFAQLNPIGFILGLVPVLTFCLLT